MRESLFTDVILKNNWEKMSDSERLKILQQFEHENSVFQGREEREVVDMPFGGDALGDFVMAYDDKNNIIKSANVKYCPAEIAISGLYGTGFHVSYNDYYNDKTNLKTFVIIEKEKLDDEYTKLLLFLSRAKYEGVETYISLESYMASLAKIESCLYLLDKIWDACENSEDCKRLASQYVEAYDILRNYNNAIENNYNVVMTLKKVRLLVDEFDSKYLKSALIPIKTSKVIVDNVKPELNDVFRENYMLYDAGSSVPQPFGDIFADQFAENYHQLPNRKR